MCYNEQQKERMMEKPKIYLETTVFSFYHESREHGEYPKFKA